MTHPASIKQPQKFNPGFLMPCPVRPSECLYPGELPKTLLTSPPMKLQRKDAMSNSLNGRPSETRQPSFCFQSSKAPWNPFEFSLCPPWNSLDKKHESLRIHHDGQRRSHHPSFSLTTHIHLTLDAGHSTTA